jgi:predicted permease
VALGAPRWALARIAALEGGLLVGASAVAGGVLGWATVGLLAASLPNILLLSTSNPVDLDGRALAYMAAVAAVAWLVSALPPVFAASRPSLTTLLRHDDRTVAASRGAVWLRRSLTVIEIAVAVTLVIGALLHVRTYQQLLAVEKGFDSRGLVQVSYTLPFQHYPTQADRRALAARFIAEARTVPGVLAGTWSSPPPSAGDSPSEVRVEIDDAPAGNTAELVGVNRVDAEYFSVIRLPLRRGRYLQADDPETNVVVSESFARRFFHDGDAIGHSFRRFPREPWLTIVGVVGDFRTARTRMPAPGDRVTHYYALWPRPPQAAPASASGPPSPPRVDTGGSYGFVTTTIRTDGTVPAAALRAVAERLDPRLRVTVSDVDEMYASQNADTRLTTNIVSAFGALAFVVAIAGLYGVMAFLVAGRTREIGIRMALGADRGAVQRLVLLSATRMVVVGAIAGVGLAVLASRWIESQLFGVSPTDVPTYAVVALAVVATALLATWLPARQAAAVDPVVTLKSE